VPVRLRARRRGARSRAVPRAYTEQRGYPPMTQAHGQAVGLRLHHRRALLTGDREVLYRLGAVPVLGGNQAPDFRSIARFRQRHLQALRGCSSRASSSVSKQAWCGSGAWPSTGASEGRTPHGERHELQPDVEERDGAQERDRGAVGTSRGDRCQRGRGFGRPARRRAHR